ncbi:hypothetical protein QJ857_gp0670 [Tupanvirus soda lake]|uniref:2'-phosphotransferase n=2 Tax=Tupanvirus TaxID=2094720 RepID=A0A6N1NLC7_9VIRU|nr:hypothetical protein QJ857_gp0670 [Tupanvirus soda lake]QKU35374.1 hypothetical protein [Tupanvirus soda lake]
MSYSIRFSRYLSSVLRHQAVKQGYAIDVRGFVPVNEIIKRSTNITFDDIQKIVNGNDKKRFELEQRQDGWYIRAVQGHTMEGINPDLALITDPKQIPIVVHGTNHKAYQSIKDSGLNRMERNHIHFAHGTPDDDTVISGMRKTATVMIYIDAEKAMADGIKFYKSSNGVILSEGINGVISPTYFSKVEFA